MESCVSVMLVNMRFWLMILLLGLCGCHSPNPHLPVFWTRTAVDPLLLADDASHPTLHLFIIYSSNLCSHTVLRISDPSLGTVFWDPAGGYGKPDYPVVARRVRDLVVNPVPSLADYIHFRNYLPTASMEIFEFLLDPVVARKMIEALRGEDTSSPWDTRTQAFQCSSNISSFLATHGGERFRMKSFFFPHDLAAQLYEIGPDRLYLLNQTGFYLYLPPPNKSLSQTARTQDLP